MAMRLTTAVFLGLSVDEFDEGFFPNLD